MANFSNILTATRNAIRFSFFGANAGNNALATIKDLNNLTNQLNNIFSYRMYDFSLTQTGGAVPVLTQLAVGAGECRYNCDCVSLDCGCSAPCGQETATGFTYFDIVKTAPGVFDITVALPSEFVAKNPATIKKIGLSIGPLPNYGDQVIITPGGAPNIFTLTTYNISGAPVDDIFTDTIIAAKIYF